MVAQFASLAGAPPDSQHVPPRAGQGAARRSQLGRYTWARLEAALRRPAPSFCFGVDGLMRCVPAHDFTVMKAYLWRSAIQEKPPYQRESSVWSLEKQQLFIDSLLNGYDVPKIYLHDLRGIEETKVYAVVDGKQRLTTIWRFLKNEFPLAADFRIEANNYPELPPDAVTPGPGMYFKEMDPVWQEVLKTTFLAVVLIQNAREEDIEDLFSRLNNGEPLNAAEKRNALGGEMAALIREVATRPFFGQRLAFSNARYHHFDLAAKLLFIESVRLDGDSEIPDLRSRTLDEFVRANRRLEPDRRSVLAAAVDANLAIMERVFDHHDSLLAALPNPPVFYLFVSRMAAQLPDERLPGRLSMFLRTFNRQRIESLERPEEEQDADLHEFSLLLQQGTNEKANLERRVAILTRGFVAENPDLLPAAAAVE
jgi:hypothetical protein